MKRALVGMVTCVVSAWLVAHCSSSATTGAPIGNDAGGSDGAVPTDSATDGETATGSDGGSPPPSCAPGGAGMTDCGASRESCCTSLEVPGGTYYRAYDLTDAGTLTLAADGGPAAEAHPATVSGFRLDKYLVTVGRFRQFVAAWGVGWYPRGGSGKHAYLNEGQGLAVAPNVDAGQGYEPGWLAPWDNTTCIDPTDGNLVCNASNATWTPSPAGQENLPINCVSWFEAYAFCIWDGGFLPSEAEWAFAAAGGSQQREYPWGAGSPDASNPYAIYADEFSGNPTGIAPVGSASAGAGRWGQLDMAGEVWEWNLDRFASYADPCADCANLISSPYAVLRGGSFVDDATYLLSAYRLSSPSGRDVSVGFRCARSP